MSTSPPSLLLSRASKYDERRFKTINLPCEWVEDYCPGGYHPVLLGDVFNNGQYKVIRKLGDGSYSTVWLARDLRLVHFLLSVCDTIDDGCLFSSKRNSRYVALKLLVSENSGSTPEARILRCITKVASVEEAQHITQLLDEFEHHGPNGIHKCLVFEPMGPSVNTMVEELPQFKPRKLGLKVRYPPQMAKSVLKQSLQALVFLHEINIAHGDFQPGNMLFTLKDINSESEDTLWQKGDVQDWSISPPVQRLDGMQDKSAPQYLCVGQPLVRFTNYTEGFKIKLSDMGGG